MNEIIKLSIDKYKVKELDNTHLSKVELYVCHDKQNKNGSYFELENMVKCQNSILRKPFLFAMNGSNTDFDQHNDYLDKAGYFDPIENDMRYEEVDGRIYFVVSALIWNVYSPQVLEIFKRDGTKGISMEIEVLDYEKMDDGVINITDYRYLGVVLLGNDIETGMYNTTAKLIEFSKYEFNKMIDKSSKDNSVFKDVNIDDKTKGGKQMDKFNRDVHAEKFKMTAKDVKCAMIDAFKDKNMYIEDYCADFIYVYNWEDSKFYKYPYSMEKGVCSVDFSCGKKVKYTFVDIEEDEEDEDVVVGFAEELVLKTIAIESEKFNKEIEDLKVELETLKTEKTEFSEKVEELNKTIEENTEKSKENEDAIFSLNDEIKNLKEELEVKNSEVEELSTFKVAQEKVEKENKVNELFSKVNTALTKSEIEEWTAKESEYETFEIFENELTKFALSKVLSTYKKSNFSRVAVDNVNEDPKDENKSIWDKVDEHINNK